MWKKHFLFCHKGCISKITTLFFYLFSFNAEVAMPKPCDLQINIDGQQIFLLKEVFISVLHWLFLVWYRYIFQRKIIINISCVRRGDTSFIYFCRRSYQNTVEGWRNYWITKREDVMWRSWGLESMISLEDQKGLS